MVYEVKYFYQYLYGQKFTLLTEHQPLRTIFNPSKGIPSLAAARLRHGVLLLSACNYDINFMRSKEHGNAYGLLRLPLPSSQPAIGEEGVTIFYVDQI